MPPLRRARNRTVGLKRIDAAIDATGSMGFPVPLVRATVKKLLKAYGGDVGWAFIEEDSYKLLIETILEDQEKSERENDKPQLLLEDGSPKDESKHSAQQMDIVLPSKNDQRDEEHGQEADLPQSYSAQKHSPGEMDIDSCFSAKDEPSHAKLGKPLPLPSSQISSTGVESSPRRKPCYGWLSSDEEDEPDLVPLVPGSC